MNPEELVSHWKAEERIARIPGWDFSHIHDKYTEEEDLSWDYREAILRYLRPEMRLLDIDTGGGTFWENAGQSSPKKGAILWRKQDIQSGIGSFFGAGSRNGRKPI